jgi:signal transduction histidine kinase
MTEKRKPNRLKNQIAKRNSRLVRQVQELSEVNRDLEAFNQAVSHDLRTSLTRIYTSGQALQEYGETLDPNGLFFVKCINDGCEELEMLLSALMGLSKMTDGELCVELVDLGALAEVKIAELRLSQPERHVDFVIDPDLQVQGDRRLLAIALSNLLQNAWNYTARASDASVHFGSFRAFDGETVFFVKDNGVGFDSSRSEQLFRPFKRLHSQHDFPGTGLGLVTVRRIVQRHNGRIWGEGAPGEGATFFFTVNGPSCL